MTTGESVKVNGRVCRFVEWANAFGERVWRIEGLYEIPGAQMPAILDHYGKWNEIGAIGAGAMIDWRTEDEAREYVRELTAAHSDQPAQAAEASEGTELPETTWSAAENDALSVLAREQGLTRQQLLRQCLRLYQLQCHRIKEGETCVWSGDARRAADFAGTSIPAASAADGGASEAELPTGPGVWIRQGKAINVIKDRDGTLIVAHQEVQWVRDISPMMRGGWRPAGVAEGEREKFDAELRRYQDQCADALIGVAIEKKKLEYELATARADNARLQSELTSLNAFHDQQAMQQGESLIAAKSRAEQLAEALRFYADKKNYNGDYAPGKVISPAGEHFWSCDTGQTARAALADTPQETNK